MRDSQVFQTLGWPPACIAGEENPSDKGFCQIKVEMTWHHLILWPGLMPGVPDSWLAPSLRSKGRRIHLMKVFCQIKVKMTWHHLVLWPGLRKPENAAECETTRWHSLLVFRATSMWRKECYFATDRTQDVNLLYRVNLDNSRADYG